MLFVRDKGRMCNNLLQYGHVYAWAREHGRHTVSMRFAYKYPYFHIGHTRWHNFLVYALAKGAARVGLLPTASFDSPDGNPEAQRLMDTHRWLMVQGWYVRYYDLFLKYKQDILGLFAFSPEVSRATDSYIAQTGGSQGLRLGVHIRRGDYRTWMGGRYYYDDQVYIDYIRCFVASQSQPVHIYMWKRPLAEPRAVRAGAGRRGAVLCHRLAGRRPVPAVALPVHHRGTQHLLAGRVDVSRQPPVLDDGSPGRWRGSAVWPV